eukprot:jgi/Chrzof1/12988/Cz07g15130.t1
MRCSVGHTWKVGLTTCHHSTGLQAAFQKRQLLLKQRSRRRRHRATVAMSGTDGNGGAVPPSKRVVICGAGIIGAATAYYLSQMGVAATVVEREAVACAASGKAGGFLALNWSDGSPVGPLSRKSYALHAQLAEALGADTIGYRPVDTLQVVGSAVAGSGPKQRLQHDLPTWLDGHVLGSSKLGDKSNTAQVHPAKLTTALLHAAQSAGARLIHGTVEGVQLNAAGNGVEGVVVGDDVIPADDVIIAMGPWSQSARAWLPLPSISGQKYHSVVLRPHTPVTAHMIFTGFKLANGRSVEPEIYPRPDGTVYVCGEPEAVAVPASPADVNVVPELSANIQAVVGSLSSALRDAPVEAQQACYLPLSSDGLPVIGRVPGIAGAYVATGHSCWGILNGPATGLGLAELIVQAKSKSVDLRAFDPARLRRECSQVVQFYVTPEYVPAPIALVGTDDMSVGPADEGFSWLTPPVFAVAVTIVVLGVWLWSQRKLSVKPVARNRVADPESQMVYAVRRSAAIDRLQAQYATAAEAYQATQAAKQAEQQKKAIQGRPVCEARWMTLALLAMRIVMPQQQQQQQQQQQPACVASSMCIGTSCSFWLGVTS